MKNTYLDQLAMFQDFHKAIAYPEFKMATEKAVLSAHNQSIAGIDEVIAQADAFYAPKLVEG